MTVNHDVRAGSDEALITDLRRITSAVDGPPAWVLDAARAAFLTHDVDAELAVLTGDSRAAGFEAVRADGSSRAQGHWLLSFEGGGVQVDMEVSERAGRLSLIGQFSGVTGDCFLETADRRWPIPVDDLGRFILDDLPHGRIRLRCQSAGGAPVTTVWVTV